MQPDDIETMETQLAEITAWQKANMDKLGTVEFTKRTLTHRILTDLVRANGGTPDMRAWAGWSLKTIEYGTHPLLKATTHRSK